MDMRKLSRWAASTAGVVGLVAVGIVVGGKPAGAASMDGQLRIHATGSIYAGPDAIIAVPTAIGGVATYSLAVVNKGTSLAQFDVTVTPPDGSNVTVASGSVFTTPLALSSDGYFTKPIAPGKSEILTMKVTTPAGTGKHDLLFGTVQLWSTNHDFINQVEFVNTVKATAGASTNDIVTTATGSASVVAEPGPFSTTVTSAQPVKRGGAAVYSVKLQNDGATAAQIHGTLSHDPFCDYGVVAKVGSVDVTNQLLAGTYTTPLLAHAKFTTLTITVRPGAFTSCTLEQDAVSADYGSNDTSVAALLTNLAAA